MKNEYEFENVTYKYYSGLYPCDRYSIEELRPNYIDTTDSGLGYAQSSFKNLNESLRRDFLAVLRLWRIDQFADDLKTGPRKQYIFSQMDLDFVIELLFRYQKDDLWTSEIRKNLKSSYFFELFFSSKSRKQLLVEAEFVKTGFLCLYERRGFPEEKNSAFRFQLNRVLPLAILNEAFRSQKETFSLCAQLVSDMPMSFK